MRNKKKKIIISKGPLTNGKATLDTYNCGLRSRNCDSGGRQLAKYRKEPDNAREG